MVFFREVSALCWRRSSTILGFGAEAASEIGVLRCLSGALMSALFSMRICAQVKEFLQAAMWRGVSPSFEGVLTSRPSLISFLRNFGFFCMTAKWTSVRPTLLSAFWRELLSRVFAAW